MTDLCKQDVPEQEPVVLKGEHEAMRVGRNGVTYMHREPEPVAWLDVFTDEAYANSELEGLGEEVKHDLTPLYLAPPKREWVGLTDEQIENIVNRHTTDDAGYDIFCDGRGVACEVMAKLKELNT
jgi:hypothetical protein